jgi:HPr kinase/phosphorylase
MGKKIRISEFLKSTGRGIDLELRLMTGKDGLIREVDSVEINRPGLTLAGFYDFFAYERVQIFGLGETAYMRQLTEDQKRTAYEKFFSYDVMCCVFTHNEEPDAIFLALAGAKNVPVFVTARTTTRFISIFTHLIDEFFSPSLTVHGTLVEVYGIGILLMGKSGVGKSECALELVERGHRLVADDMVEVKKIDESLLMGSGTPILKHHMEIRGLGIINVRDIFGIGSVRNRKRVELVVLLEEWDSAKEYDRLGMEERMYGMLDLEVPFLTIPVRPGRNIPIIIETAALNQRLKKMGVFSAKELDEKIQEWIRMVKTANG